MEIAVAVAQILGATTHYDHHGDQHSSDDDQTKHHRHTGEGGDDEHTGGTSEDELNDVVKELLCGLGICQVSFSFCSGTAQGISLGHIIG